MPTRNLDTEFDAFARKAYGLSGNTLLAKLKKGESGGRHNAVSPAGARGEYQFMPGTRDAVLKYTGGRVDPYRSEGEGREAAMLHLLGKLGHKRGLGGYNPGGGKQYVRYILGQQVDGQDSKPASPSPASRTVKTTRTIPGVDRSDERRALILNFLQQRHRPGAVASLASGLKDAQDTPDRKATSSRTVKGSTGASNGSSGGSVRIPSSANRPGVDMTPGIKKVLRTVSARIGHPLDVGTGTNHNRLTVNGNVSDHWSGNAADLPTTPGEHNIRLGRNALVALGMSRAEAMKATGGVYNVPYGKHRRIQVIFNTNEGGNHHDHVHIGVTAGR